MRRAINQLDKLDKLVLDEEIYLLQNAQEPIAYHLTLLAYKGEQQTPYTQFGGANGTRIRSNDLRSFF